MDLRFSKWYENEDGSASIRLKSHRLNIWKVFTIGSNHVKLISKMRKEDCVRRMGLLVRLMVKKVNKEIYGR